MDFKTQFTAALRAYCTLRNMDTDALFPVPMENSDKGTALRELDALWKEIMHITNDGQFGLHFGEAMQLTALGIVGQIITTSNTVGEALAKAGPMVSLIAEGFVVRTEVVGDDAIIELWCEETIRSQYPYYHRGMGDFLGALFIHELDGLIIGKITPKRISIPFSMDSLEEYCRVLRCKEYTHSGTIGITIDRKLLGIPIISADYAMQRYLESVLSENLLANSAQTQLKARVGAYIRNNSYLRILSVDDVAANFHMGSRTLQRKLREEGSSFQEIVDTVRKELALHYLKDKNNQIKEVAYSLGYNESSAFVRAFKRWTGKTPSMYYS